MTLNTVAWRQLFSEFFVYFFFGELIWGIRWFQSQQNCEYPPHSRLPAKDTWILWIIQRFGLFSNKNGSLYIFLKENLSQIEGMWVWLFAAFSVLGPVIPFHIPRVSQLLSGYLQVGPKFPWIVAGHNSNTQAWILDFVMLAFLFQMVVRLHPSTTTNNMTIWDFHHFGKNIQHTSSLKVSQHFLLRFPSEFRRCIHLQPISLFRVQT